VIYPKLQRTVALKFLPHDSNLDKKQRPTYSPTCGADTLIRQLSGQHISSVHPSQTRRHWFGKMLLEEFNTRMRRPGSVHRNDREQTSPSRADV
jgi:hypothetical protein